MPTARGVAWYVLTRVSRDRAFADLALHATLRDVELDKRDRAFATELAYGTLRMRGRIDYILADVVERDLDRVELPVLELIRLGAYQILFLQGVRDSAAVSESVELAKRSGFGRAGGFVNAILRRVITNATSVRFPDLEDDPVGYLTHWGSLPTWLAELCFDQLGPMEAAAFAETCVSAPPRTVRVSKGGDPERVAKQLGGRRCRFAPAGVTRVTRDPVRRPAFDRGEYTVQDEAAQLVPYMLGVEPGDTVIDACAAPGAKTLELAEFAGPEGEVIAFDAAENRLGLVRRGVQRLGLTNVRTLVRDAAQSFDLRGRQRFPRILVDAPCSGLGVLRRNPDARWRLAPEDVTRAGQRAGAILESSARYVEEGGALVYSVCTFTREETTDVIDRFLDENEGFRRDDPRPFLPKTAAEELVDESGALVTWPQHHGCDGFWAVRLVRA